MFFKIHLYKHSWFLAFPQASRFNLSTKLSWICLFPSLLSLSWSKLPSFPVCPTEITSWLSLHASTVASSQPALHISEFLNRSLKTTNQIKSLPAHQLHWAPATLNCQRFAADLTPASSLAPSSLHLPHRAPVTPASFLFEQTKLFLPQALCTCCCNWSSYGWLHSITQLHCHFAHRGSVFPSYLTEGSNILDSLVLFLSWHLSLREIVYFLYIFSFSNEKISGQGSQGKEEKAVKIFINKFLEKT